MTESDPSESATQTPYQGPMQPWPALEPYTRTLQLPTSRLLLHLYDAGERDAPPLILIHGLGDEADTWRHLIPPLSNRFRVVAPDLPGFGRSDKPDVAYTLAFYQDVVLELLATLGFEQATLLGDSLGAVIVHSLALSHPERVARLILVGSSMVVRAQKLDLATILYLVPRLGEWLYNRRRGHPQAAYRSLEPYYGQLSRLPAADREFLFHRVNQRVWSDGQRRAFLSTLRHLARWLPGQQRDLPGRLANLQIPTLAVWGELDRINAVASGRALVQLQPSARLVVVPGAGHNVHQEKPEAVVAAILCRGSTRDRAQA